MADVVYNSFKGHLLSGAIDLSAATLKIMLTTSSYSVDIDTHRLTGDITNEITSTNYVGGGNLIPSTAVTVEITDNEAVLTGHAVTFTGITASPAFGIIYISGATPATNYLLGQVDFGSQTLSDSDLVINWNSEGIYNLA